VDYLVGTANATLTNEIVVGTAPAGELGGTWASPTIDATHSGSAHHTQSHNHSVAGDGTTLAPTALTVDGLEVARLLDRTTSDLDIVSTAAETTLYSVTVPANAMGTDRAVELDIIGDYFNNSGAGRTYTFKVKFGGTIIYQDASISITAAATRRPWVCTLLLANQGATNAQSGSGHLWIPPSTAPTTGTGAMSVTAAAPWCFLFADSTIDSTANQTFELTIQHSASNASLSLRRRYAAATLL
jgi:hypothetical protein